MEKMTFNEMALVKGGRPASWTEGDTCRAIGYASAAIVSYFATPFGGILWAYGYDRYVKCPN